MLRGQCLGLGVVSVLDKDLAGEGATGFRPALIDRAAGLRVEVDAGASLRSPRQDRRAGLSPPSTRARARARDGAGNQRPWPADKVERWPVTLELGIDV